MSPFLTTLGGGSVRGFGRLYRAISGLAAGSAGSLWTWGLNSSGQLGQGDYTALANPTKVGTLSTWNAVSMAQHVLATKTDGTLWSWGLNIFGQLGQGNTVELTSPVQVGALTTWVAITAQVFWSFAIKSDGTLWAWGQNDYGQLGIGNTSNRSSPVQVGSLTNWASTGYGVNRYSSYAVKTTGTLWAWGYGGQGDPVDAYWNTWINTPYATAYPKTTRSSPTQVGSSANWAEVSFGDTHALVITTSGTLWAWGINNYGKCGQGTFYNNPALYNYQSRYGSCAGGGSAIFGVNYAAPVSMANFPNVLNSDESECTEGVLGSTVDEYYTAANTFLWGFSSPVQIGSLAWAGISAGADHSFGIRTNGTLWAWGLNNDGVLGVNNTTTYSSPVQIGALTNWAYIKAGWETSLAVKTDGTLWSWGKLPYGAPSVSSPVQVGSATTWIPQLDSLSMSVRSINTNPPSYIALSTA